MSIKYLSCRSSTGNDITSSNTEMLVYLDACLTCLDLLLLISSPFWLSSDCLTLSSSSLKHKHRDVTSVHWSSRMTADVSVTSLSRPGWVWRDKRAAGFLGWFVSLLCCSSVSSWPCEEHLGYRLRNSTAVPSPGYKLKSISKSEFITRQLSDVKIIYMTGMHRWCTLLEFYYKTSLLTPNITKLKTAFNSGAAESDSNHMLICCSIIIGAQLLIMVLIINVRIMFYCLILCGNVFSGSFDE